MKYPDECSNGVGSPGDEARRLFRLRGFSTIRAVRRVAPSPMRRRVWSVSSPAKTLPAAVDATAASARVATRYRRIISESGAESSASSK